MRLPIASRGSTYHCSLGERFNLWNSSTSDSSLDLLSAVFTRSNPPHAGSTSVTILSNPNIMIRLLLVVVEAEELTKLLLSEILEGSPVPRLLRIRIRAKELVLGLSSTSLGCAWRLLHNFGGVHELARCDHLRRVSLP